MNLNGHDSGQTWLPLEAGFTLRPEEMAQCRRRRCGHMRVSHEHGNDSLKCVICDCKWFRWPSPFWWLMWLR